MAGKLLKWLVRLTGISCLFAIPFVFVPRAWMESIHEWSGLGKLPEGVIVSYLARATSAFYGMFGGLMLLCSFDVRKYRAVIAYCAWLGIAFGAVMTAHNLMMHMPVNWIMVDAAAPPTGVAILLLQRAARKAEAAAPAGQIP
jgi:hypothetical protein